MAISLPSLSWSQINTEDYLPYRDIEATDSGIVVTYTFRGGIHQPDPLHPEAKFWKIPGFGLNDNATEPGFPFRWDSFTIPDDAEVNITLLDSAYTDTLFRLAPAYPPLLNSDTIGYTPQRVPAIAPYIGFYPNSAVLKGDIQAYRGQGIIRVATLPVQYNYQTGTVRAFSRIKYLVSFTDVNTRAKIRGRNYVSERADSHISHSDHFLENTTLNYNLSSNRRRNIQSRTGVEPAELDNRSYLIITTNDFLDAVNEFAEWKRTKGFNVIIESRNSWNNNVDSVKNVIRNHYNTNNDLYYLLIVGDINDVPSETNTSHLDTENTNDVIVSDTYYSWNNSLDSLYLYSGRITCNSQNVNTVLNKNISYERNPPTNSNYYNTIVNCAHCEREDYDIRRTILNSEYIKRYLENYISMNKNCIRLYNAPVASTQKYFITDTLSVLMPNDLQYPDYSWTVTPNDIINKINEGCIFLSYLGHGLENSFSSITPAFVTNSVNQLNNGNLLPIIFSAGCRNGRFNYSYNCIAEDLLNKSNGGAVAVYACSYEAYNHAMIAILDYIIDAIWPNPGFISNFHTFNWMYNYENMYSISELGPLMTLGIQRMFSTWNMSYSNGMKFATKERLHLFGDPSMMIYTKQPTEISNPTINVNGNTIHVETTLSKARISFYTPGTTPVVDSYLGNSVDYTTTADSVIICIDRQNCIPHIVTYRRNEFIQNETISDARTYVGKNIKIGRNVTNTKPEGDVAIDGADVVIHGGNVELHPGTTIINSNVLINPQ